MSRARASWRRSSNMRRARNRRHTGTQIRPAYVLSGAVRSQVNDEPVKVYKVGESWFEAPGAHHRVSENASETEPARLLAIFVLDTAEKTLTTPDPK